MPPVTREMVSRPDKSVTCTNCGGREREGSKRFNLPAASFPAAYYSGKGSWGLDRRAVSSPLNGCCFNTVLLIARSSPLVLRALTVSLKLAKIWATCSCVCLCVRQDFQPVGCAGEDGRVQSKAWRWRAAVHRYTHIAKPRLCLLQN